MFMVSKDSKAEHPLSATPKRCYCCDIEIPVKQKYCLTRVYFPGRSIDKMGICLSCEKIMKAIFAGYTDYIYLERILIFGRNVGIGLPEPSLERNNKLSSELIESEKMEKKRISDLVGNVSRKIKEYHEEVKTSYKNID